MPNNNKKTQLQMNKTIRLSKPFQTLFGIVFLLIYSHASWGQIQLSETFNETTTTVTTGGTGMASAYSTGNYVLSSGTWSFTNAIKGTQNVNSSPGCQVKTGTGNNIISPNIVNGGVSTITFYAAGTSAGAAVNVSISINGGAFSSGTSFTSLTTISTQKTVTINDISDNIKVKFTNTAGTLTLDDIVINTAEPTTQASAVTFSSVASTAMTASWTNGNGGRRAVFMKATSGAITNPSDGTAYSSSSDWNSKGTQLGTSGYYCIYNGTGSSVALTNLVANTAYYFQVFEYNSNDNTTPTASTINYFTSTATNNPNNQSTPSANYTVTYDSNGGSGSLSDPSSPYVPAATVTVLANTFTRAGYTFAGWNTLATGFGTDRAAANTFLISANTILYAKWTANSNTITFNGNGFTAGSTTSQNIATAASANLTANGYSRTGYTFAGWNTVAGGGGTSYTNSVNYTMGTTNVTLYAQWTANTNTITFNGNGYTGGSTASQNIATAASANLTANGYTRTGYTFAGWNTVDVGGGTSYANSVNYTMGTASVTLYAQWTLNSAYSVAYNANGGTGSQIDATAYNSGDIATVLGVGTIARTGYTFVKWNTADNGSGTDYVPTATFSVTATTTLYAQWSVNSYTVTYDGNGNTGGTVPAVPTSYNFGATVTTATTGSLVRAGYTSFDIWSTISNGGGSNYNATGLVTFAMPANNVTLYANWSANTNTITFNGNGFTSGSTTSQNIATSSSANLTANGFTRTGYTFAGWNTIALGGGTSYSNNGSYTMGTANITLYAQWTANNNTITFNANGATGGTTSTQTIATAAIANLTANGYTRTGYTFAGWNTIAVGGGTSYANSVSYTMGTANVILYAQWTPNTNTIAFDANGGAGSMTPQTLATAAVANLSTNTFTRTLGYSFASWNTAANGSGTSYANGASYTMGTANVTLYAQWVVPVVNVFSENFGTPTGTTAITTYLSGTAPATFQNGAPITFTGTADVRTTSPSTGLYTNASGNGNLYLTNTIGKDIQIANINTSTYTNLGFTFGLYKSTTATVIDLIVEISTDGTNYIPLTYTLSSASAWSLITTTGTIPSTTNLRIRFRQTATATQYRIDDITLTGQANPNPEIDITGNGVSIASGATTTSATNYTDFGSTAVVGGSVTRTFTIQNLGLSDITLNGSSSYVSITGAPAGVFTLTSNPSTPIVNGTPTTFNITFDPTTIGAQTATVSIANNDSNENPYTFTIQGTGINSSASDIITDTNYSYNSNINYLSYQGTSVDISSVNSIDVYKFILRDGGTTANDTDSVGTILTDLTFTATNIANIRSAALFDAAGTTKIATADLSGGTIAFTGLSGASVTASDDLSKTFVLRVTFLTTVTDNQQMVFTVSSATASSTGSGFAAANAGAAVSSATAGVNKIVVTADRLSFLTQPSAASIGVNISPAPVVIATDINNNKDEDITSGTIAVTSTGTLATTQSGTTANGSLTFGTMSFTNSGTFTVVANYTGTTSLTSVTSNSFVITDATEGSYRSTFGGTWHSTQGSGSSTWEKLTSGVWNNVGVLVPTSGTATIYVRHALTLVGNNTASNIIIENGGSISTSTIAPSWTNVLIKNGGTLNKEGNSVTINGTFEIEDGGTLTFKHSNSGTSRSTTIWAGTEKFHANSIVKVLGSDTTVMNLFESSTDISEYTDITNTTTACFGNLILDCGTGKIQLVPSGFTRQLTHKDLILRTNSATNSIFSGAFTTTIGGNLTVENTFNSAATLLTAAAVATLTIKGNLVHSAPRTLNLLNNASGNMTLNVEGDILINPASTGTLNLNTTGTVNLNLKGDLTVGVSGLLSATSTTAFNFSGGGDGASAANTQTIDIASSGLTETQNISFKVINSLVSPFPASYVKLINQNLELGNNSTFTVNSGNTLDFGFDGAYNSGTNLSAGTTALLIKEVPATASYTAFTLTAGGTLKITSSKGLVTVANASAANGNVQLDTRTFGQTGSTFYYLGKADQETGDIFSTGSTPKNITCDLDTNALKLTLTGGTTGVGTGISSPGTLYIKKGIFVESNDVNISGTGNLTIDTAGTFKTAVISPVVVPQLSGTYTLSGGTIELNAAGNQILNGTPSYNNITFSNSGIKTVSSAIATINGTVTIQDTAIVDAGSSTFGGTGTNLTMTGTSRLIVSGARTLPDMTGTYSLTGGTIEFAGSSTSHAAKSPINYNNILISGTNVNGGSGNYTLNNGGTFTVNSGATFNATDQRIIAGGATASITINGTFNTANVNGFSGNSTTSISPTNTSITLGSNATIQYSRTSAQAVSTRTDYANLSIVNTGIKSISGAIGLSGNLNIGSGSTLNANTFVITPSSLSVVTIDGTVQTANLNGFSGASTTTLSNTNNFTTALTNSTIEYNASASQTLSSRNDYNNIIANNSGGLVLNGACTLNGILSLTSGTVNLGSNNLTIGTAGSIAVTTLDATKMIVATGAGQLKKMVTGNSTFTFPIGDTTGTADYSPITISTLGSSYTGASISVSVADANHPNNNSATNFLTRYWTVNQSGISDCTLTLNGTYTALDISGNVNAIKAAQLVGTFNQATNPWIKTGGNVLTGTTLTFNGAVLASGQPSVFTGISSSDPIITTINDSTVCRNAVTTLTAVVTGEGPYLYSWTGLITGATTTASVTASTATSGGPNLYTISVKDANGIIATTSTNLTVDSKNTWAGATSTAWTNPENWSCGYVPDATTDIIINSGTNNPLITNDISINSLTITTGASLTVPSGIDITVADVITTIDTGIMIINSGANLLQTNALAINSGNITVKRDSAPIVRLDHTLWSSPVTGSQKLLDFSPNTLPTRFYNYSTANNAYVAVTNPSTTMFQKGLGVAIRASNSQRTPVAPAPLLGDTWTGTFIGVPTNGSFDVPVSLRHNSTTNADYAYGYNLLGNPYPSAIDGAAFLTNNPGLEGTLYFYCHTLTMNSSGLFPADGGSTNYSTWNLTAASENEPHGVPAATGNGHSTAIRPDGTIQVGQGFLVKALSAGTVSFTNGLRTGNNSANFMRTTPIERNRIWLNLKTDTGTDLNSILVGYVEGATQDVDVNYDGLTFGTTGSSLSSKIGIADYTIQGRSLPFNSSDVVPLGFKAAYIGNYAISLTETDGLFSGNQDIFVRDNLMGTDHNIKVSPYTFASDAGTFDARFELVYTQALGIPATNFNPNSVIVYKNTDWFHVNTKGITMKEIQVYDISGRLIYKLPNINATTTILKGLTATNEVLFLKITSEDNETVTVKAIGY